MVDDDLGLLDRWCTGDAAAGNALFKRHYEEVHRFLSNKIERADAADLVQETFLACLRGRDGFRRVSSFRTYLFAIARNTLYRYWQRGQRGREALDFDEVSIESLSTTAGTRIARDQDRARLLAALRRLPLEHQLLLELHYWQDLDGDQLAEVFGVERATTRSRLHRARQDLRARLDRAAERATPRAGPDDLDAWVRSMRAEADDFRNTEPDDGTTGP